jgi:hypothetical protein
MKKTWISGKNENENLARQTTDNFLAIENCFLTFTSKMDINVACWMYRIRDSNIDDKKTAIVNRVATAREAVRYLR